MQTKSAWTGGTGRGSSELDHNWRVSWAPAALQGAGGSSPGPWGDRGAQPGQAIGSFHAAR